MFNNKQQVTRHISTSRRLPSGGRSAACRKFLVGVGKIADGHFDVLLDRRQLARRLMIAAYRTARG
jgi:hypothetical protein